MNLVDEMNMAIQKAKGIGTPITEYRIHPDDYSALRSQVKVFTSDPQTHHFGLRLILDEQAARLPRKSAA